MSNEKSKKASFLPNISPNRNPTKKDFIEHAAGDDHDHDDSQSQIKDDGFANSDIDPDFAYLRYHFQSGHSGRDWKLVYDN